MRLSEKRTEYLRTEMPYGMWTMPDGSLVLFNRRYEPIWYIQKGKSAVPMDRDRFINWELQVHFYRDSNSPWRNRHTLKICGDILTNLGIKNEIEDWKV